MHTAAAVTDRLLSIHAGADPRRVGPYNPQSLDLEHGKILRVRELENTKLKRRDRAFKSKDTSALLELIRPFVPIDPMLA